MRHKTILILLILFSSVFALGCVDNETETEDVPDVKMPIDTASIDDLIPTKDLPIGITYLGVHEVVIENATESIEAVYKNSNKDDFYVRVAKTDSKDSAKKLIEDYKSQYNGYRYNPFEEVMLNNHSATQIKDYTIQQGKNEFTYLYIWNNENYVFIVSSNILNDNSLTFEIAQAVGY
ncbi:MAG: hypothetical protein ANIMEMIM_00224 [Candidatus Argoarchaeum ethanivorans]|uniref:DUF4367 domain-containing protein n=1 Tax=Candidatus Argoarchaeum ethanivorans TaxID=2608793 RepID=A0A811T7I8_9EURY|nr:MAG: hypothetical protein ANIMEMIM_00224 [Candidatus Argoarchaeum ethanivorans]